MYEDLKRAIENQEHEDFETLSELYNEFFEAEESGKTDTAIKIMKQIEELQNEMGL